MIIKLISSKIDLAELCKIEILFVIISFDSRWQSIIIGYVPKRINEVRLVSKFSDLSIGREGDR